MFWPTLHKHMNIHKYTLKPLLHTLEVLLLPRDRIIKKPPPKATERSYAGAGRYAHNGGPSLSTAE